MATNNEAYGLSAFGSFLENFVKGRKEKQAAQIQQKQFEDTLAMKALELQRGQEEKEYNRQVDLFDRLRKQDLKYGNLPNGQFGVVGMTQPADPQILGQLPGPLGQTARTTFKNVTRSADGQLVYTAPSPATSDAETTSNPLGGTMSINTPKQEKEKALNNVTDFLRQLEGYYTALDRSGGIVSTDRPAGENVAASLAASRPGQLLGRTVGTKDQEQRNKIRQVKPLLIQSIRQATQMGARGLDSEKELEFYLEAATDPSVDIQTNINALNVLDKAYGLGLGIKRTASPQQQSVLPGAKTQPKDAKSFIGEMESKGFKFKGVKP